jgi:hypothetical protein
MNRPVFKKCNHDIFSGKCSIAPILVPLSANEMWGICSVCKEKFLLHEREKHVLSWDKNVAYRALIESRPTCKVAIDELVASVLQKRDDEILSKIHELEKDPYGMDYAVKSEEYNKALKDIEAFIKFNE